MYLIRKYKKESIQWNNKVRQKLKKYEQIRSTLIYPQLPREDEAIIGIICSFNKSVCMHSKILV